MIQTLDPIRRSVVVDLDPQGAFDLFTTNMTRWWPADHHIGAAPIEDIIIEPREGGRWYTRHTDGSETSTGHVRVWDPPSRLVLIWSIGADWTYDPTLITAVELRFTAESPDRTRVSLEHRDLDAYGPAAEKMHQTFDAPGAWDATLAAYAAAAAS
ncbi:MAG TPA: SRPBCC family protein [Baekduia sp.]|nr:SRPBCC family protein [Baekduia sp.]